MTESFDTIVLGGGAWGSAATQHLAARKHRVLCIDRFTPPHTHGSTHGHSRLINSNAETSSNNAQLIARSYELWKVLEELSGKSLMQRVGYLFVGSPDSQRMQSSLGSSRTAGLNHQVLDAAEMRRRFPQFRVQPDEVGIFDQQASRLDPERCVTAAFDIALRNGAALRFGEEVLDWSADAERVEVVTSKGRYNADQLVIALGVWTSQLSKLELPLWVERQVMVWFRYSDETMSGFSFPAEPRATSLYGIPEAGGRVKVAFHHGGSPTDPDVVSPVTDADLGPVRELLADRVPAMTDMAASATCMYTNTPDLQYVAGPHPLFDRVTILAGGSGRGFHQAQVVGEYAADRVERKPRPDFDWLSMSRFARTEPAARRSDLPGT
jgi:sarcosine oxidase